MSEHTVEEPAVKRLERSRSDRMLTGVCGGLARYFDIHPAFYRVGFVVLTLLGGAGIVIYAAAWLVMPDEGKADSVASAALRDRRDKPWPLIGLGLVAVAGAVLLSRATVWPRGDLWVVFLVAGAAILWITRHGTAQAPAARADEPDVGATAQPAAGRGPSRMRRVLGALAIAFAAWIALLFVLAAIFAGVVHVHLGRGVGDRTYDVAGVQDLRRDYRLGIGSLRLDLSDVQLPRGAETHVDASVDVGNLEVTVPANAAVQVHGDAQFGRVNVLGRVGSGHDVDRYATQAGARTLVLDAHVGAGALHVKRAVR